MSDSKDSPDVPVPASEVSIRDLVRHQIRKAWASIRQEAQKCGEELQQDGLIDEDGNWTEKGWNIVKKFSLPERPDRPLVNREDVNAYIDHLEAEIQRLSQK